MSEYHQYLGQEAPESVSLRIYGNKDVYYSYCTQYRKHTVYCGAGISQKELFEAKS